MKRLLVILLVILYAPVAADIPTGTYEFKPAGKKLWRQFRDASCGAERLLRDRHRLVYDGSRVRINNTPWDLIDVRDYSIVVGKGRHPNKTRYWIYIEDDGRLHAQFVLFGNLPTYAGDPYYPHGKPCEDRLHLIGRRIR